MGRRPGIFFLFVEAWIRWRLHSAPRVAFCAFPRDLRRQPPNILSTSVLNVGRRPWMFFIVRVSN